MFKMRYKVTYRIDSLDTDPAVEYFDDQNEMFDYISEEVATRLEFAVAHSPYGLSCADIKDMEETEYSLVRIDEL